MARYINQGNRDWCGPVAVYNALVWAGASVTRELLASIARDARCYDHGSSFDDVLYALKKQGAPYFTTEATWGYARLKTVEKRLRRGDAAMIFYAFDRNGKWEKHVALITNVSLDGTRFLAANFFSNAPIAPITRARLRHALRRRKIGEVSPYFPSDVWGPKAIFIGRRQAAYV